MAGYVQLPGYQPAPGIDFGPVNNAFAAITQQNNRNALMDFERQKFQAENTRADKQLAIQQQQADDTHNDTVENLRHKLVTYMAGSAQDILDDPNPQSQSMRAQKYIAAHPDLAPTLLKNGIDPNDHVGALNAIVAEARGYQNPLDVREKQAKISESEASTAKSRAEAEAMRRNAALVNSLMPEFTGNGGGGTGGADTSGPTTSYYPPGNALAGGPPNNALAAFGVPPSTQPRNALMMSGPTNRALPPMAAPQNALAPRPPVDPSVSSAPPPQPPREQRAALVQPSTALPNPGDPTSFTGDSASGLTTPTRISADTKRAMAYDLALNNGKGMSTILNNDPGSKYATTYATKTAEDNAALNLKQKMTEPMLDIIHSMREKLDAAGPEIADMATGPNYGQLSEDPGSLERGFKSILPDTSGEFYQNARAGVRNIANNIPLVPQIYNNTVRPVLGTSTLGEMADKGNAARNLNLELHHLVKGIGAGVKAIPGTKGGGVSTDADQALVLDAVGEAMHSADWTTRNNILFDAENILRARAGKTLLQTPPGYRPSALASRYSTEGASAPSASSSSSGTADALAGARAAIQRGADPSAVRQRLIQNGINPEDL